jgi:predicted GIY-YIG superfamily endonuclease
MSYCVYKLENDKNELYFGMTKNPDRRWLGHMQNARDDGTCSSKKLWYDSSCVVGMYELEWFETEEEAHEREKELIQGNNCVNQIKYNHDWKAYKKAWDMENKEHNTIVKNKWGRDNYDKFKDKKNSWKREKITCDNCGISVSRNSMARHKRRDICKNYTSAAALDC